MFACQILLLIFFAGLKSAIDLIAITEEQSEEITAGYVCLFYSSINSLSVFYFIAVSIPFSLCKRSFSWPRQPAPLLHKTQPNTDSMYRNTAQHNQHNSTQHNKTQYINNSIPHHTMHFQ
jgi:hypothetical protein